MEVRHGFIKQIDLLIEPRTMPHIYFSLNPKAYIYIYIYIYIYVLSSKNQCSLARAKGEHQHINNCQKFS
jgi:hypothetical protein